MKTIWASLLAITVVVANGANYVAQAAIQPPITDPQSIASTPNPSAAPIPIDDLLFSREVMGPAWSPDGKQIVFTTNLTGRQNLWKVNGEGGWPIQLVQSDDRQLDAMWSPDGKWVFYEQDTGGNEQYQVYKISSDGGEPSDFSKNPEIRFTDFHFSPDGQFLAVNIKHKSSPSTDVAVYDLATEKLRNLTQEKTPNHWWTISTWSPDGRAIFATRQNTSFTDSSVYRIDIGSGAIDELTPHAGQTVISASSVSPDGHMLLVTSNEKGGRGNVALLDLATRKLQWMTDSSGDAAGAYFSPDNRHFTYVVSADGRTETFIDDREGHTQKLTFQAGITEPEGNPNAYADGGQRLLLSHQDAKHPGDLWVYNTGTRKAKQISYSAIASLNPAMLPASQIIHYKTFDGKTISAILWMPFNLKRDGSNPAVVIAHGGPTYQTSDAFNPTAAALASRGFICIAPNVRGSTGFGIDFQKANYQDLGGGDLQDEVYATKFLLATGYVDGKKIGITGGSYGGYMTLMALGKTPDVWAAGVEEYGVVSWKTMMEYSDPFLQSYIRSLLGDPAKDSAVYDSTSSLKYLPNAKAPLLVLQGANDVRVPKEEAEQVVDIYKKDGKTVAAKFYPQEGHGFSKREDQVDALYRLVDWFQRYLKGGATETIQ